MTKGVYMHRISLKFLLFCSYIASGQLHANILTPMHRMMQQMGHEMASSISQIRHYAMQDQDSIISCSEDDTHVHIMVTLNPDLKNFEAKIKENNHLTIVIPQARQSIEVTTQKQFISIGTTISKQEINDSDEKKSSTTSFGSSFFTRTIGDPIDLNQVSIEFQNGKLSIKIPKILTPKNERKINVVIKDSEQQEINDIK